MIRIRRMFQHGQGVVTLRESFSFSDFQRAVTVAGLGPAMLMGCAVHQDAQFAAYLPAPTYKVSLPIPAALKALFHPTAPAPQELVSSLDALTRNFGGIAGVSVASVDQGWLISSNGERKLPQQSVSKLWVTMTVLDQIDQGKLSLDTPVSISREDFTVFHQPVAALVKDGQPYQTTVAELIRRAMQMSDNTCNDKLLRLVGGPDAVREFIARRSLGPIRFGPGERLLQAGTAGLEWRPEYSLGNAFAVARSRLAPSVRKAAFEAYVADPPDGAAPLAIAGALARLKRGELLSPTSTDWLIKTMEAARTGKARVRAAVPPGWTYAHKTGTGQDLGGRTAGFNDVGILTAPDGRGYALAVMVGDTNRPVRERQLLMQQVASAIVANHGR
ncbi:serine hydrolase [Sphingomonas soli]|uniref:serine hydrolase n=1 Tax=Sphingomonas soli TaxID=266127 RepID=UPI001FDFDAED|nr:serine hydrolase [Sphingomonas soli]